MQPSPQTAQFLPLFRKDLKLYRGPYDADGAPTYNLLDPVRGQYYKINWKESLIFKHLKQDMTAQKLSEEINKVSTLKVEPLDIERFFMQCASLDLLRVRRSSEFYQARHDQRQVSWWYWILQHYLYLRIPLLNPDKFLSRTLHYVRPFAHPIALSLYFLLSIWGLMLILRQFDEFIHTFTYFFNLQGLIYYGLAISAVKIVHEFSHAFVAKRYGLHVPTMGIAFIVLWPVLYTDVTDGWKLSKRSQRLAISFAGIAAELIVAGLSTLGWALTSPGMLHSIFYVLATSSLIATLVINTNPAVRFDGYYMLCDIWGIDNLQFRAFNVLRWKYLKWLFDMDTPSPEEGLKPSILNGMAIYAIYTYIYRILLYTGIAIFVYYEFTKALGILLFIAEVFIFMVWPVYSEGKQIYMLRSHFHWNVRSIITTLVIGLASAWFIIPLPHEVSFHAIIEPVQEQVLYVPYDAKVDQVFVKRDQVVKTNDPLINLSSKMLLKDLGTGLLEKNLLETEVKNLTIESQDANFVAEKKAELAKANDYYEEMLRKERLMSMKALIPGVVYDWNDDLKPGISLAQGTVIGKIADPSQAYAITYVPEDQISYFSLGQPATIVILNPLTYIKGEVVRVIPARSETLTYFNLASIYRGPLPVTTDETGRHLFLVESYYIVYVKIPPADAKNLKFGTLAEVRIRGPWTSKAAQLYRYVRRIILRESSL